MPTVIADLVIGINTVRYLNLITFNNTTAEGIKPDMNPYSVDSVRVLSDSENEKRRPEQFLHEELNLFKESPGRTNILEHHQIEAECISSEAEALP